MQSRQPHHYSGYEKRLPLRMLGPSFLVRILIPKTDDVHVRHEDGHGQRENIR